MLENFGIGIDIVEIKRFQEKPFEKNINFIKKYLQNLKLNIV